MFDPTPKEKLLWTPGIKLFARGGALFVRKDGVQHNLPYPTTARIWIGSRCQVTSGARFELLRRGVDVVFLGPDLSYMGMLVSPSSSSIQTKLAQFSLYNNPSKRLQWAQHRIAEKIQNQIQLIKDKCKTKQISTQSHLHQALAQCHDTLSIDELFGVEGYASAHYFQAFSNCIKNPGFSFSIRMKRPPPDPINALLSFSYTVLLSSIIGAIHAVGLEPKLGMMHGNARNQDGLAYDIMEYFRCESDRMVLSLVNRKQIQSKHFQQKKENCVWLNQKGLKIVLSTWRKRLRPKILGGKGLGNTILNHIQSIVRNIKIECASIPF